MNNFNFVDTLATRDHKILKYDKETSSGLSDGVKRATFMNKTPGQLQYHLRLNAASLALRDVVVNYVKSKHICKEDPNAMNMCKVSK